MSRAKTRRPGTRSERQRRADSIGPTGAFTRRKPAPTELPDDLPEAAEAALDDLLSAAEHTTSDREPEITSDIHDVARPRRALPPPAPGARPPRAKTPRPVASKAGTVDESQFVEENVLPALESLSFAIFEEAEHVASARAAVVAAGHQVAATATGRDGVAKIVDVVVNEGVDVVLVSVPGGEAIVDAALALEPGRPIVIASLAGKATEAVKRAIATGADLAVTRPHDHERLAPVLLAVARIHTERRIAQNARGTELVLRARLDEIADPEPRGLQPFEVFQRVLELEFKRARRFEYSLSVALFAVEVTPPPPPAGIRGILRARAGNALIHTIRDIDLATQLDHERFLVLLPYTDLSGAANLGRRVIAAVASGDPVTSGGRSFPPRVVGAVAGGSPGQPLSFAKLMKDATRALEQARRDGAELAVQP